MALGYFKLAIIVAGIEFPRMAARKGTEPGATEQRLGEAVAPLIGGGTLGARWASSPERGLEVLLRGAAQLEDSRGADEHREQAAAAPRPAGSPRPAAASSASRGRRTTSESVFCAMKISRTIRIRKPTISDDPQRRGPGELDLVDRPDVRAAVPVAAAAPAGPAASARRAIPAVRCS